MLSISKLSSSATATSRATASTRADTASDSYWVEQYKLGNQQAMGILYLRYFSKVYHKCLSLSKDPDTAFDLAQDALLKAFDHLHTFKENASFSTWLYSLTYNHYREFFRKGKRLVVLPLREDYQEQEDGVVQEAVKQEAETRIMALLNRINETDKTMLVLKYYQGRSVEHLQRQFNLSAGAVKMRLQRARHKLNSLYQRAVA